MSSIINVNKKIECKYSFRAQRLMNIFKKLFKRLSSKKTSGERVEEKINIKDLVFRLDSSFLEERNKAFNLLAGLGDEAIDELSPFLKDEGRRKIVLKIIILSV